MSNDSKNSNANNNGVVRIENVNTLNEIEEALKIAADPITVEALIYKTLMKPQDEYRDSLLFMLQNEKINMIQRLADTNDVNLTTLDWDEIKKILPANRPDLRYVVLIGRGNSHTGHKTDGHTIPTVGEKDKIVFPIDKEMNFEILPPPGYTGHQIAA